MFSITLATRFRFFETCANIRVFVHAPLQMRLQIGNAFDMTTEKNAVVSRHQRALGDHFVWAEIGDGVHLHVVTDGDAVEAKRVAQQVVRQPPAERGRHIFFIDSRIRTVADHHRARFAAESRVWNEIAMH